MIFKDIKVLGNSYKWSAQQDSQHPDFVLVCDAGEIWVQVGDTYDQAHNEAYLNGKEECPVSEKTAKRIITEIIQKGYIESYFNTDVGLMLYTNQGLEEN